jgi:hypothetical protein
MKRRQQVVRRLDEKILDDCETKLNERERNTVSTLIFKNFL